MNPYQLNIPAGCRYILFSILFISSLRLQATIDFGVSEIIAPVGGCGMSESEFVVVEIKNYGNVSVAGFPVSFQVNGGIVYTEMVLLPLDDGDSTINYFGISYDFTLPGFYTIKAWTDGDAHPDNDTSTIIIESLATPAIDLGPDLTICSAQILDAENAGSTYAWNTGETTQSILVETSGTYSVTITNPGTGCTSTDEIEISIIEMPVSGFDYLLADLTCSFTNTSLNGTTYNWDFGDGSMSDEINPVHIYALAGVYNVTLAATNECNTDVLSQVVEWPLSINSNPINILHLSPNPANEMVKIKLNNNTYSQAKLRMINSLGENVYTTEILNSEFNIYLTEIPPGIYTLILTEKDQKIIAEKLLVQK